MQVQLTLALAAVAVPINTLFGISAALLIARNNFPGKTVLLAILDLPFSISPVVTGLMLVSVSACHFHAGCQRLPFVCLMISPGRATWASGSLL